MRIVLADDHALFRDGVRSLLEARGFEVVGEASDGREAVELANRLAPDVLLMDLDMPNMTGLDATRTLTAQATSVKILMLTASEDDADLFEAIKAGAQGFLFKNLKADELVGMLEAVGRGEPGLTPKLARKVLGEFARPTPNKQMRASDQLTEREQDVPAWRVGNS